MKHSRSLENIAPAIVRAQAAMPQVSKDKTATVPTKSGGQYSYAYADIAHIAAEIRPVLAEHELAIMQTQGFCVVGAVVYDTLTTRIIHASGEWIEDTALLPTARVDANGLPTCPAAQEVGSAMTYTRRYGTSIIGVVTESDDDGATAAGTGRPAARGGSAKAASDKQIEFIKRLTKELTDIPDVPAWAEQHIGRVERDITKLTSGDAKAMIDAMIAHRDAAKSDDDNVPF